MEPSINEREIGLKNFAFSHHKGHIFYMFLLIFQNLQFLGIFPFTGNYLKRIRISRNSGNFLQSGKTGSEQQRRLQFCTRYFYRVLYTNLKYGQILQSLFWLKSLIRVDCKVVVFQLPSNISWLNSRRVCMFLIKERNRRSFFIHIVFVMWKEHTCK